MNAWKSCHKCRGNRNAVLKKDTANAMDRSCEQCRSSSDNRKNDLYTQHHKETTGNSEAHNEKRVLEHLILTC